MLAVYREARGGLQRRRRGSVIFPGRMCKISQNRRAWRAGTAPRTQRRRERNHKEMNMKSTNKRIYDYIRRLRHTTTGKACYFLPTNLIRLRCWRTDILLILTIPGYGPPPGPWRDATISGRLERRTPSLLWRRSPRARAGWDDEPGHSSYDVL